MPWATFLNSVSLLCQVEMGELKKKKGTKLTSVSAVWFLSLVSATNEILGMP